MEHEIIHVLNVLEQEDWHVSVKFANERERGKKMTKARVLVVLEMTLKEANEIQEIKDRLIEFRKTTGISEVYKFNMYTPEVEEIQEFAQSGQNILLRDE